MNKIDRENNLPIIRIIGSDCQLKYELLDNLQNSEGVFMNLHDISAKKKSDYDVFFFSEKQDDKFLVNLGNNRPFVVCSDTYPNKDLLSNLGNTRTIMLHTNVDAISKQLSFLLASFQTIGENMQSGIGTTPKTGNIFRWDGGGGTPRDWQCPAIVTNNIKGIHQFDCIGFDDGTKQTYRIGNGEIKETTFPVIKDYLIKDRHVDNVDAYLKSVKLTIVKMKNLTL